MPNYCQTIWSTYKTLDKTHTEVAENWERMVQSGDIELGKNLIKKIEEKERSLEEIWRETFTEVDSILIIKEEWQALQQLIADNDGVYITRPSQDINDNTAISDSGHIVKIAIGESMKDLSAFRKLPELGHLTLFDATGVDGISALGNLPKLFRLYADGLQATDISPLGNLQNLRSVSLKNGKFSDLTPLTSSPITNLDISGNENVTNLTPLTDIDTLKALDINNNTKVTDLTPLLQMSSLRSVFARGLSCLNEPAQKEVIKTLMQRGVNVSIY